jgi:hypothetical protein
VVDVDAAEEEIRARVLREEMAPRVSEKEDGGCRGESGRERVNWLRERDHKRERDSEREREIARERER